MDKDLVDLLNNDLSRLSEDELSAQLDIINKRVAEEAKKRNNDYRHERRQSHENSCSGHFEADDIARFWELQDGQCYFCWTQLGRVGKKHAFAKDHLTPVSDYNGTHWPHNIALVCYDCNSNKAGRTERSFWMRLEKKHSKAWVSVRREKAQSNKKEKKKSTMLRKKDRKVGMMFLEKEIEERVASTPELLARHDGRPDIWLNDCERSRHIEINYDEASIACLGPKGGLKSAKAWFSRYGASVVDALIALDSTNPKRRF